MEAHSMSSWISVAVDLSSSNIRNAKDIIIESLIGGFKMSHMANANESKNPVDEDLIREKARDKDAEVGAYLKANPRASLKGLQASHDFSNIAILYVGKNGYSCLYAPSGIMRVHPNPALVDCDMSFLADTITSWWPIFGKSLSGKEASGYCDRVEPDGSLSKKYMAISPVEIPFRGDYTDVMRYDLFK
jgi:hypothetical protein